MSMLIYPPVILFPLALLWFGSFLIELFYEQNKCTAFLCLIASTLSFWSALSFVIRAN